MATARDLTAEQLAGYRAAARRRQQVELEALAARERRAWELARDAAELLRRDFNAEQVLVFGSLVHPGCFTRWSDVDIAAFGIDPQDTLRAMEAVHAISDDIPVNLVDVGTSSASLRATIDQDGQPV